MNNQPFQLSVWLRSKPGLVTLAFLAIAAFYLIAEHTAHVFGILPYALFLLCPLLHLFMHGGHGEHTNDHTQHTGQRTQERYAIQDTVDHSEHSEELR